MSRADRIRQQQGLVYWADAVKNKQHMNKDEGSSHSMTTRSTLSILAMEEIDCPTRMYRVGSKGNHNHTHGVADGEEERQATMKKILSTPALSETTENNENGNGAKIPRRIHLFTPRLSLDTASELIQSWKAAYPDFTIVLYDDSTIDRFWKMKLVGPISHTCLLSSKCV